MLAEVHGKLSPESTQDAERLEDLLTDYVFGGLKRLPRSALFRVVDDAFPEIGISSADADGAQFDFWPQWTDTEPDVAVVIGNWLLVIEAKLWSGFSSRNVIDGHQLVREYKRAEEQCERRRLQGPLVLAVTAGFERPRDLGEVNRHLQEQRAGQLGSDVFDAVRWLSWQQIASILEDAAAQGMGRRDKETAGDILAVMERRGVRTVFEGFVREDFWLLAAAQRRASDVVFPTIATFCKDVLARLEEADVRRAMNDQRVLAYQSASLNSPQRWGWNYLFLPVWPKSWPAKKTWDRAYLFIQFSLREPEVWVGFRQAVEPRQVATWRERMDDYIASLNRRPGYRVSVAKYPDLGTPLRQIMSEDIDGTWMADALSLAGCSLAFYRVLDLDALTSTAAVADMLLEDRDVVESTDFLLRETIDLAERE